MSMVQQVIEVGAPLHTVYQQLAAFEHDPRFRVTERSLDERVSWSTTDGPLLAETITLRPIDASHTQVVAQLEADLAALLPSDQRGQQTLSRRLKDDLMSLKGLVESGVVTPASVLSGASSKQLAGGAGFGNGTRADRPSPASVAARIRRAGRSDAAPGPATSSGSAPIGGRAPARDLTGDGVINETDRGGTDTF